MTHSIKWDRGRQQWIVTDVSTFKRVGAFDSLHQAETWILSLVDDVIDLDARTEAEVER